MLERKNIKYVSINKESSKVYKRSTLTGDIFDLLPLEHQLWFTKDGEGRRNTLRMNTVPNFTPLDAPNNNIDHINRSGERIFNNNHGRIHERLVSTNSLLIQYDMNIVSANIEHNRRFPLASVGQSNDFNNTFNLLLDNRTLSITLGGLRYLGRDIIDFITYILNNPLGFITMVQIRNYPNIRDDLRIIQELVIPEFDDGIF